MVIVVDEKSKQITLSVKDLVLLDPQKHRKGIRRAFYYTGAYEGRQIHETIQQRRIREIEGYRKEVFFRENLYIGAWKVIIRGRADGVFEVEKGTVVVEEIKSIPLNPENLEETSLWAFKTQLKLYVYLYMKKNSAKIICRLLLVDPDSLKEKILEFQQEDMIDFIINGVEKILADWEYRKAIRIEKEISANKLIFPFDEVRPFQEQLMTTVKEAVESKNCLLVSAPTGIGKTAGVLFPALKFALKNDKKIVFATSKTTQQKIVVETIQRIIQQTGEQNCSFTAVILRAKKKICPNEEFICHEDACRFLLGYWETSIPRLIKELRAKKMIYPDQILAIGLREEVCPFDLSIDLCLTTDVVIGDYNYFFDPRVALRRLFDPELNPQEMVLIIDEAHNLKSRAMGYYSPEFPKSGIQKIVSTCNKRKLDDLEIFDSIKDLVERIGGEIESLSSERPAGEYSGKFLVHPDSGYFRSKRIALAKLLSKYFKFMRDRNEVVSRDDPFLEFYYTLKWFSDVASLPDFLNTEMKELDIIYQEKKDAGLKILCKDPSRLLSQTLSKFYSTIVMSATLEPHFFYREILGLPVETRILSLPSPFPKENREILLVPTISTRYRKREQYYASVAELITQIVKVKKGNYGAFFPSFRYLDEIKKRLQNKKIKFLIQRKSMNQEEKREILEILSTSQENLLLAVHGGVLAEGVDYPGEMLVGAIIVGPGLPLYCYEQEMIKQYFDDKYGNGFAYAYAFPGMNRVIQAAGRVIRSQQDKGIIVLLGERFKESLYNSVFPSHWYKESPLELISHNLEQKIASFWEGISTPIKKIQ